MMREPLSNLMTPTLISSVKAVGRPSRIEAGDFEVFLAVGEDGAGEVEEFGEVVD